MLLLAPFSFAVSAQQESVRFSVTEVSDLVKVDGSLDFSQLLPGYEYVTNLTVRWNIGTGALRNINAVEVPLYVRITPAAADSWVYFDGGEKRLLFTLKCSVRGGECAQGSALSMPVQVHIRAPEGAVYPHSDGIIANASLVPFNGDAALGAPGEAGRAPDTDELPGPKKDGYAPELLGGPITGFAVLANTPVVGNIIFALLALGAILLLVYFREYLFEKIIIPKEKRDI